MSGIVPVIGSAATIKVSTPYANQYKAVSVSEVYNPVVISTAITGNNISLVDRSDAVSLRSSYNHNPSGTSLFFNGANDYITISPNNIGSFANSQLTDLNLNGGINFTNNSILYLPAGPNVGNTNITFFNGAEWLTSSANATAITFTGDFTMEAFIFPISTGSLGTRWPIIDTRSGATTTSWVFAVTSISSSHGKVSLYVAGTDQSSSLLVPFYKWSHIALVRSGSTIRFYVNGILDTTTRTVAGTITPSGTAMRIGAQQETTTRAGGYITNLKVVNGIDVYGTSNFTPPSLPLTVSTNTVFLGLANTTQIDQSASAFTLTPTGSPAIVPANNIYLYDGTNKLPPLAAFSGSSALANTELTPLTVNTFSSYAGVFANTNNLRIAANTFLTPGNNPFTIEFWVNQTANHTGGHVLFQVGGGTAGQQIQMFVNTTSTYLISPATTTTSVTTNLNFMLPQYSWSHIVVQRANSSLVQVFRNGSVVANISTNSTNFNITSSSLLSVGSDIAPTTTSRFRGGQISNFRYIIGSNAYPVTNFVNLPTANLTSNTQTAALLLQSSSPTTDLGNNNLTVLNEGTPTVSTVLANNIGVGAFDLSAHDFTVDSWVYLNSFPVNNFSVLYRISDGFSTASVANAGIQVSAGVNRTAVFVAGSAVANVEPIPLNKWVHVALVKTTANNTMSVYYDGIFKGAGTTSTTFHGNFEITSGWQYPFPNQSDILDGAISNLRFTKGVALYSGANNYTNNFVVPTLPLTSISNSTAVTTLLTAQNSSPTLVDNSGYNFRVGYSYIGNSALTNPYGNSYANGLLTSPNTFATVNPYFNLSSNATVDMWIYPTSNTGTKVIVDQMVSNTTNSGNWKLYLNDGVLSYDYDGNNTITGGAITTNTWTHIAIVKDTSNVSLYANGSLANTIAYSNVFGNTTTTLYVGASQQGSVGNYFTGYINDLRIANGAIIPPAGGPSTPSAAENSMLLLQNPTSAGVSARYNGGTTTTGFSTFTYNTNISSLPFSIGSNNFTFEAWVNLQNIPLTDVYITGTYTIFAHSNSSSGQAIFSVGKTKLVSFIGGAAQITSTNNHNMAANTWYHLAFVRSSNTMTFYVNGQSIGSVSATNAITTATGAGQGNYVGGLPNYSGVMQGYISNIRYVKNASLYTSNFTPPVMPFDNLANNNFTFLNSQPFASYDLTSGYATAAILSSASPFNDYYIQDDSKNNYKINYARYNGPEVTKLNPFQTSNTYSPMEVFPVTAIASNTLTYNNYKMTYTTNEVTMVSYEQRNASQLKYVNSNTQAVVISSNVTIVNATAGGALTQFEDWS